MHSSPLMEVFLPLALGLVMFGLGLSLSLKDFTRVVERPKAALIALSCQLIVLPALCWALVEISGLPEQGTRGPALAVGMVLLAASPGGATASLFSHLFRGDVALNVTLLAVNSVVSVLTLPLLVNLAISHYYAGTGDQVGLQPVDTLKVFAVVLIPVALGMLVRHHRAVFAARADRWVRGGSVLVLAVVVTAALVGERHNLWDYLTQIGTLAVVFCLVNLTVGYFVPRKLDIDPPQSIAISMEIGVHNETLAMTVALTVLDNTTLAVPAAVYSILKFAIIPAFGYVVTRRARRTAKPARRT
ncbi:bile acid:sodium symporter family protein [Streptomyces chartreusis]|uniref:bile acid:sodium symporter family protein n=1 Tax=Streptomyces chartreusis TaxID=1969 RepID=UPI0037F66358